METFRQPANANKRVFIAHSRRWICLFSQTLIMIGTYIFSKFSSFDFLSVKDFSQICVYWTQMVFYILLDFARGFARIIIDDS